MAYNEAQMSGSGDYRVGLDIYPTSQDAGANQTTFWWGGYLQSFGGSWFLDPAPWSARLAEGFAPRSGTWNRTSGEAGTQTKLIAAGYIVVDHAADGTRPGFWNEFSLASPHAAIGNGSVQTWVDAPRIPKRPLGPDAAPTFDQVTATSFRVNYGGSYNHMGSTVTNLLLRISKNANPEQSPYTDYLVSGTTYSQVITGLDPATRYYAKVYSRNAVGYSNGSAVGFQDTLAGVYVSDGTKWVAQPMRVSDGTAWQNVNPDISDGTVWRDPINV